MDELKILQDIKSANITGIRFVRTDAQLLRTDISGKGHLSATVTLDLKAPTSVADSTKKITLTTVDVRVLGIPHGEDGEAAAAFKIEVKAEATYEWPSMPSIEFLAQELALVELAKGPYLLVVAEVRAVATRMGLNGIGLELDIRRAIEKNKTSDSTSKQKPLVNKLAGAKRVLKAKKVET